MANEITTSSQRRSLFIELATRSGGVSVTDVFEEAQRRGDTVTLEAYYNLARRLAHRGLVVAESSDGSVMYKVGAEPDTLWLEEEQLASMIDPDYPIPALAIWKESIHQINDLPRSLWTELRERLKSQPARELYLKAIESYCDDLHAQVCELARVWNRPTPDQTDLRKEAERTRQLLINLTKFGLGLSEEAVRLPLTLDGAIKDARTTEPPPYCDKAILREEIAERVADEMFLVAIPEGGKNEHLLIGAVDGSVRSGVLSMFGEDGDMAIGNAPMVAINTAVGQVNRFLQTKGRKIPVFARLPEKPEDMQAADNRYTMMARLLYPDLSESEYMHAVWNAMDLLEARATGRLMSLWEIPNSTTEVPPCDVVLRDGTVSPQDREFSHYMELGSAGKIARALIEANWDIAQKCQSNGQTVAGVIKAAQLTVFGPVINWFACQVAAQRQGQLVAWPLQTMNLIPDQILLTRMLTEGRKEGDPWMRSCLVARPFHAITNFNLTYSRSRPPSQVILDRAAQELSQGQNADPERRVFYETYFRRHNDPFVKMLDNVSYGTFFLGAVPQLDAGKYLPRFELLITRDPAKDGPESLWAGARTHMGRLLSAIRQTGFDVSAEHSMFASPGQLDVLPALLIQAHDTVKIWAADLLARVQEVIGFYLAREIKGRKSRGVKIRPITRQELESLYQQLSREREMRPESAAGTPRLLEQ